MERFKEDLKQAIKNIKIADHMTYVTLPLVNEKRLILKIFDEIHKSIINCINASLNYEYLYKRIKLYNSRDKNIETFLKKCAKNYSLTNQQIEKIKEILIINKKHKQSAMEFVKKEKVIILSDNLKTKYLDIEIIKEYLLLTKELFIKLNKKMNQ
ncbi:hypothetical protein GF386_06870 [Candidatus Pacearchaeota archaeon]|nr:hypothetical protein [Candidatus Pacearchaeota archaeon]MBD3283803.1 hypothetical protein [Candidatus Pacearchaeota archaeon]